MNWDAIGAIGEVIGAVAVVFSLLYLATQVRHSSRTAEDAAFRDVFAAVTAQFTSMAEGPNSEIIIKGLKDFDSLTGSEKYTFDKLMSSFITLVESTFISNQGQFIPDETMENWSYVLRTRYFAYPGWRAWWEQSRAIYIPEAQEWFDRQIARTDQNSDYWRIKNDS